MTIINNLSKLVILTIFTFSMLLSEQTVINNKSEDKKPLVSIHAEDTHLPSILAILAEESGYNIVTGPNVQSKNKLTELAYRVTQLKETEPPFSYHGFDGSTGIYKCVCCENPLFNSKTKYESGSGWPSFFQSLPDVFETKTDQLLGYARTEYHCKNCDAHHGHIFNDGPNPTGKRYCNNGICLVFKPKG